MSSSTAIYRFTLHFKKDKLEKKYFQKHIDDMLTFNKYYVGALALVMFAFCIQEVIRAAAGAPRRNYTIVIVSWCTYSIGTYLIYLIGQYSRLVRSISGVIYILGIYIVITESNIQLYPTFNASIGMLLIHSLCFYSGIFLVYRWYIAGFAFFISFLYYYLRNSFAYDILDQSNIPFTLVATLLVMLGLLYCAELLRRGEFSYLKKSEYVTKRWTHFLRTMPESVLIFDKGSIVFYNNEVQKLFNIDCDLDPDYIKEKLEAELKNTYGSLSTGNDSNSTFFQVKKSLWEVVTETLSGQSDKELSFTEHYEIKKNSNSKHLEATGRFTLFNNSTDSFILIIKDVTTYKELEVSKAVSNYKSILLASTVHELRNPLNGVIGMLEVIENHVSDQGKYFLKVARNSSHHLLNLINDILDYSQAEVGKLRLVYTDFNLKEVVQEAIDLMSIQAGKKNIELLSDYDISIPEYINADRNRFRQVLLNLIGNAIKFTFQGYIKVSCCIQSMHRDLEMNTSTNCIMLKPEKLLTVHVEDTGVGIKEEDKPCLFNLFGKLERTKQINQNGVGLGLTISKSICNKMGGDIVVDSEWGKGSVFTFTIKLHDTLLNDNLPDITPLQRYNDINNRAHGENGSITIPLEAEINSIVNNQSQIFKPNISRINFSKFNKKHNATVLLSHRRTITPTHRRNKSCSCPRIMVVDDNALNTLAISSMIKQLGKMAREAESGDEAIRAILESNMRECGCEPIDLILMDLHMPIMSGFQLYQRILELVAKGEISKPRVIVVSGGISREEEERLREMGLVEYMDKPIFFDQLKNLFL